MFNDGLHQYPAADLTDETFTGTVWVLAVPKAVVLLAEDIAAWEEKNGEARFKPVHERKLRPGTVTQRQAAEMPTRAPGRAGRALLKAG